ncbi:MAG: AAA family ATPase [FCB group bacterium]|jgi:AAA+ superfamily predicted ATPase|nr:AAA family ATPase [FCB group bacterium]
MANKFLEEMDRLVRARYPLLYVVTWEEERARKYLMALAEGQGKSLFEWSITDGFRRLMGPKDAPRPEQRTREPMAVLNEIMQSDIPAIYVLKDFHGYLETPEIVRQLRDLAMSLRRSKKTLIILSPIVKLPPELEKAVTFVDLPLPGYSELKDLFDAAIGDSRSRRFQVNLTEADKEAMAKAAQGLTLNEAESAFAHAIVRDGVLDAGDIQSVVSEKKQIIRKSGVLDYYDPSESIGSVGGMDLLKEWLAKRVKAFSEEARQYGLPQPRGILLMGVQGCGKSLLAKAIAASWQLPLLRMDMSMIFQGFIGSSEQNMRRALSVAESVAPVILWIDEIEKALSGMESSGSTDGGTTARVMGIFLTWLQEKSSPVFVVATANQVNGLPPELLRKGRFDETFFVDLPRREEREEILRIHLQKLRRDPRKFDIAGLSQASSGFSGAEIEQAIVSALHDGFFARREIVTDDILKSIQETVPLSTTMRENIETLRAWARHRARPVSTQQRMGAVEQS